MQSTMVCGRQIMILSIAWFQFLCLTARGNRHVAASPNWTFIHIPKTGGQSLLLDSTLHVAGTILLDNNEQSLQHSLTNDNDPTITLIRDPVSHVLSQFLECKYDAWGNSVTKFTDFPGYGKSSDVIGGFKQWVQHFLEVEKPNLFTPRQREEYAYNCYDPHNMQARYFVKDCGTHVSKTDYCKTPSLELAKQALGSVTVVGLTKFYSPSLCLLEFHATGTLSPKCQICNGSQLLAQTQHHHLTHHVPPHHVGMIDTETVTAVRKLTAVDLKLYDFSVALFLEQVKQVYNATGIDLLCRQSRTAEATTNTAKQSQQILLIGSNSIITTAVRYVVATLVLGLYVHRCKAMSRKKLRRK